MIYIFRLLKFEVDENRERSSFPFAPSIQTMPLKCPKEASSPWLKSAISQRRKLGELDHATTALERVTSGHLMVWVPPKTGRKGTAGPEGTLTTGC